MLPAYLGLQNRANTRSHLPLARVKTPATACRKNGECRLRHTAHGYPELGPRCFNFTFIARPLVHAVRRPPRPRPVPLGMRMRGGVLRRSQEARELLASDGATAQGARDDAPELPRVHPQDLGGLVVERVVRVRLEEQVQQPVDH